jgi:hypothetical protein
MNGQILLAKSARLYARERGEQHMCVVAIRQIVSHVGSRSMSSQGEIYPQTPLNLLLNKFTYMPKNICSSL